MTIDPTDCPRETTEAGADADAATPRPLTFGRALIRPVRPAACWVAVLFFWASLYATLLPRSWWAQAAVTGVSVDVGIVVGTALAALVTWILGLFGRDAPRALMRRGRLLFAAVAAIVLVVGMILWRSWQDDQRRLVDMEPLEGVVVVPIVAAAAVVGLLFFVLGRLLSHPVRLFDRVLGRRLPRLAAHLITAAILVVAVVVVTRQFVLRPLGRAANDAFSTADTDTQDGVSPTTSTERSAGPGSLVDWDSLGFQGRTFIGTGPTLADLQAFSGADAVVEEPIRVYIGTRAADSQQEQADLAVRELERTGAFDRKVLAVATVTGTGWINPAVSAALEYMYAGDTAIVGTQYSYLPSWISFLVDLPAAAESGRLLVDAVHQHWDQLPADHRPRLVVFGESLGSYGSESAFDSANATASIAAVAAQTQGALWIGPTFANPVWEQILDERQSGSPVWDPLFGDGSRVAILGRPGRAPSDGQGSHPTIVYLTHPSDPVTWASADTIWSKPAWMDDPTGYDVPDRVRWFPVVTAIQTTFDLMEGFGAPPGFGHDYLPTIADGWVALAAPPGWTVDDTVRLRARLLAPA